MVPRANSDLEPPMGGRAGTALLLVGLAAVAVVATVVDAQLSVAAGLVFAGGAGGGAGLAYGLAWRRYLAGVGCGVAEEDERALASDEGQE